MGLMYCVAVIERITSSKIAKKQIQQSLCSAILEHLADFEDFFKKQNKDIVLGLAEVFQTTKETIQHYLDKLKKFHNKGDSYLECMQVKITF